MMPAHAEIPYQKILSFRRRILRFYAEHGRDLPWRTTTDPYRITISEIMLQQTQVERVVPKYLAWIKTWPSWRALARASNTELLQAWSGLGYNRRALFLGKLAKAVVERYGGKLPQDPDELRTLPGIGPYTSRAILIFAFNRPLAAIDTNIRRVLLYEFSLPATTPVTEIERLAYRVLPKQRSREWHNALMDYSRLALPKQLASIPPVSRQSRFEGSARQVRGEIIRQLLRRQPVLIRSIAKATSRDLDEVLRIVAAMAKEGVVRSSGGKLWLVD